MHGYPTDKLVAGAIVGGVFTALLVVLLVWLDFPSDRHCSAAIRLAVPALISACCSRARYYTVPCCASAATRLGSTRI
jgi:ABC-type enterobactin transport system permease subunit